MRSSLESKVSAMGDCRGGRRVLGHALALALVCVAAISPASAICQSAGKSCGVSAAFNDRLCCPGTVCGWGGRCQSACRINGVLYQSGAKNPANACQSCQPGVSTTRWSRSAPVAVDDAASVASKPLWVSAATLLANDTSLGCQTLSVTAVSNATNGTVLLAGTAITFTPAAGFNGTGGFDYTVSDGALTDTGHVTVAVTSRRLGNWPCGDHTFPTLTNVLPCLANPPCGPGHILYSLECAIQLCPGLISPVLQDWACLGCLIDTAFIPEVEQGNLFSSYNYCTGAPTVP